MVATTGSSLTTRIVSPLAEELTTLRAQLTGTLVTEADETYDVARRFHDLSQLRLPLAVVQAADENDVAAAVRFAAQNNLPLAVRSGGHGISSHATVDGALLIDLGRLAAVTIDPVSRTAHIGPGATTEVIAAVAHEHGLALSTGDTASVGFGGLATGGGIGFMARAYGLTIDNVLAARVVTADGSILVANPVEHPDLFWAIRGGGGNFGIVTEFTIRLAPVDMILGGGIILPATREVLRGIVDYAPTAPNDLTMLAHIMHCPPMPFVPAEMIGQMVVAVLVCWSGEPEAGQQALQPLRDLATPIAEMVAPMPYPAIYQFTSQQSLPHAASVRMTFADGLSDEALDGMLDAVANATSPMSLIQIRGMGGAVSRVDTYATAFPHRDQNLFIATIAVWLDPTDAGEVHKAWAEQTFAAYKHEGRGVYVNFLQDEGPERTREAYGETTWNRLVQIKKLYDPTNLFRHGQNIPPQA